MVLAFNIHFPFYIAAGAIAGGIVILSTAHQRLAAAERVQAEQVSGADAAAAAALIPVDGSAEPVAPGTAVILAAVDDSPMAALVTEAAAVLATGHDGMVHVVHTQEEATAGDVAIDGESLDAIRSMVRNHLDRSVGCRSVAEPVSALPDRVPQVLGQVL